MREVAEQLGNTPAVCRGSYVDPAVVDAFREGITIDPSLADDTGSDWARVRDPVEKAVLDLLDAV